MINQSENKRPVSELRAKQLAAIVEKRPWWRNLSFTGVARHRVSLGASALVAITFISLREYRSSAIVADAPFASTPAGAVTLAMPAPEAEAALVLPSATAIDTESKLVPVVAELSPAPVSTSAVESTGQVNLTNLMATTDMLRGGAREASSTSVEHLDSSHLSPFARSIADNLVAAKESNPELADRLLGTGIFEKRNATVNRQNGDPLAQMRSPSELHLRRMLASARPASTAGLAPDSERIARRISNERLTEEAISRFGARGDRFLLKF
jgi:hypothetical protein